MYAPILRADRIKAAGWLTLGALAVGFSAVGAIILSTIATKYLVMVCGAAAFGVRGVRALLAPVRLDAMDRHILRPADAARQSH